MIKGIDISHWQGSINFEKVKNDGVKFCIIKAGGSDNGCYTDVNFKRNYDGAKKAGIKVGAYYFVGRNFVSEKDGIADAKRFEKILDRRPFDFPIFLDLETTSIHDKDGATEATIAFCDYLEKKGYFVGIYGSDRSTFLDRIDKNKVKKFVWWVANYSREPSFAKPWEIWQCNSSGTVNGISGRVDSNFSKTDFSVIVDKHFNNN